MEKLLACYQAVLNNLISSSSSGVHKMWPSIKICTCNLNYKLWRQRIKLSVYRMRILNMKTPKQIYESKLTRLSVWKQKSRNAKKTKNILNPLAAVIRKINVMRPELAEWLCIPVNSFAAQYDSLVPHPEYCLSTKLPLHVIYVTLVRISLSQKVTQQWKAKLRIFLTGEAKWFAVFVRRFVISWMLPSLFFGIASVIIYVIYRRQEMRQRLVALNQPDNSE